MDPERRTVRLTLSIPQPCGCMVELHEEVTVVAAPCGCFAADAGLLASMLSRMNVGLAGQYAVNIFSDGGWPCSTGQHAKGCPSNQRASAHQRH